MSVNTTPNKVYISLRELPLNPTTDIKSFAFYNKIRSSIGSYLLIDVRDIEQGKEFLKNSQFRRYFLTNGRKLVLRTENRKVYLATVQDKDMPPPKRAPK